VDSAVERALVILPEAMALRDKRGQKDRALQFYRLCGVKALCGRSIPGDLIFGSFYQEKEQSHPAAIEPGQAYEREGNKRYVSSSNYLNPRPPSLSSSKKINYKN
jgi:hypothetical protein